MCLYSAMTISTIRIVSVPVSDPDEAKEFYVNVLGMEVLRDCPWVSPCGGYKLAQRAPRRRSRSSRGSDEMPAGSLQGLVARHSGHRGDHR